MRYSFMRKNYSEILIKIVYLESDDVVTTSTEFELEDDVLFG